MRFKQLSVIDTAFLELESATAPMHIGFAITFRPAEGADRPSFEQVRDHISARLARSPRYRQKVVDAPLGGWEPMWIDDPDFDFERHLVRVPDGTLDEVIDTAMSTPLEKSRPLWEMRIADRLDDGRLGIVGKAHHCMVDGLAALELATLLLDPTAATEPAEPDRWVPEPPPSVPLLRRAALANRRARFAALARGAAEVLRSPALAVRALPWAGRMTRAVVDFVRPASGSALNRPNSTRRHLVRTTHRLDDLLEIKRRHETSLNDVLLAATAGALRRFLERRGEATPRLKAIVPVDLRMSADASDLGNELSFMWIDLPVDEASPLGRLESVHRSTAERKAGGSAEAMSAVIAVVARLPRPVKRAVAHLFASPRTGNLIVSNLIGPPVPLYLLGCAVDQIHPVVPLTRRHAVSIGLMSVMGQACVSVYTDHGTLPEGDLLAQDMTASVDELLALSRAPSEASVAPTAETSRPLVAPPPSRGPV